MGLLPRSVSSPRGKRVRAGARRARADFSRVDSTHVRPAACGGAFQRRRPRRAVLHGDHGSPGPPDRGDEGLAPERASQRRALGGGGDRRDRGRDSANARDGAALEQLPETDAAFRAGQLSDVQAAEITSAAVADPSAEAELLEAAGATSVKGLRDRAREVRAGAEADDRAWARRLHVERRAHEWTDPDGAYRFEGRLAPDAGARFSSAWKTHIDRIFCDARRAGRREPRAAYAADALVALATEGPCKPVELRVTVDSAALARGHTENGERCEVDRVGPVPVTTARALLDDAAVTVMLRGATT